jgi:PilZ domain
MIDTNPMPAFLANEAFDVEVSARGEQRASLFLQAEIDVAGWSQPLRVRVRNLSAGGLLAESSHKFAVGADLRVTLPNIGTVPARCVWAGDNRFGLAFAKEINPQAALRKVGSRTDLPPTLIGMTLHTSKFKKPLRPV